jgi:glycosyltransferase involved in cell wall biosynthesis
MFIQQSLPFSREAIATLPFPARARIAVIRRMMAIAASRADHVVVQTETMAGLVGGKFRIEPARIHISSPGVPADVLSNPAPVRGEVGAQQGLRLLYVGNCSPYKNLVILERALDALQRADVTAVLAATIEPSHRLGLRSDVEALGMLGRQDLLAEYRRASCLVMPSLTETVGLPLLEAMALGVPIVAADRPYAREICGPAALYFDPLEPASLLEAVGRLRDDGSMRSQLARSGRQRAEAFSAADAYDRLLNVVLN